MGGVAPNKEVSAQGNSNPTLTVVIQLSQWLTSLWHHQRRLHHTKSEPIYRKLSTQYQGL